MKRHILLLTALGAAPLALLPIACQDGAPAKQSQQEAPAVSVVKIKQMQVTDYGEIFAYLTGQQDTDIRARVSGFLVSQDYKDGQLVKEGDVLFHIDPDLFEAELNQAKANQQAAEAGLSAAIAAQEQAELNVQRFEKLIKSNAVAQKELDDAQQTLKACIAATDAAKARIEQAKTAVDQAEINLSYTVVRAPYSGIVGAAKTSIGQLVKPSTVLANITAVNPIRVDFSVAAERMMPYLRNYADWEKTGTSHKPLPSFKLQLEDGSIFSETGQLVAVESKVTANGLINVTGEIPNPRNELRAGMPVRVLIPKDKKEALLLPKVAIRPVLRNFFILVVDKNNVPHSVPVTMDGEYPTEVNEESGYHSNQTLVAVKGVQAPLAETLKSFGYDKPTDALVVADDEHGIYAVQISAQNSRLQEGGKAQSIKTSPFSFRPKLSADLAAAVQGDGKLDPNAKPTMPPIPVKVCKLLQQDVASVSEWFGSLRGVEETDIRPKVSGFLLSQNFKDGTLVKKGDVLFTIDPALYQAAVDAAKANLNAACASREQAAATLDMCKQDYARCAALSKSSPGSVSDKTVTDAKTAVDTAQASLKKAEASVAQTKAALAQAEINLGYTTICAPFDGRIGIHNYSIGSLVSPEDPQPLVLLSSIHPMRVDFNVSGKAALIGISSFGRQTNQGQKPEAPAFRLILADGSSHKEDGHVVSADNALSKSTGTLKVIGEVPNPDGQLRSGLPVRVRAELEPVEGAFLVPVRAPLNAKGMDLLALVAPDGAPLLMPISKGKMVIIPVKEENGQTVEQPMQIIDANRKIVESLVLAKSGAPSLEAVILGGAKVQNWKEMLLQKAGAPDVRSIMEKQAGSPLPDDLPAKAGAKDWDNLFLHKAGAKDFRELILREAHAKDELDLIAYGKGNKSLMEMALKELGFTDMSQVPVVVEGSLMAAQAMMANMASHSHANKLKPEPFLYTQPQTVVASVTASETKAALEKEKSEEAKASEKPQQGVQTNAQY